MTEKDEKRTLPRQCASILVLLTIALSGAVAAAQTGRSPTPRPLGSEYEVFTAPGRSDAVAETPQYEEPSGALTLREALSLALLQNPELEAFSLEVRIQEAEALQAGLFPNPVLGVEGENFAGSGEFRGYDSGETTIVLGQLVELGGKRSKRRKVADLERELSGWDYEVRRLDILTAVTQTFVVVLEAQERLALTHELLKIAEKSLEAVRKQVRAGATSSVEQTRASVTVSSAEVERRRAQAEIETARSRLAAFWGARTATFERASGNLSELYTPPPLEVIQRNLDDNPDVARWATELARWDAVVSLEDARAIPDVTAGAGVRHLSASTDTAMVFGITVPLPVFDRNQGARHAARYGRSKARSEQRAALVRVASALEVAYQALRASFDELVALRERVIPQAEQAYQGVQTGYLRGLFRYVDVLESQRTLFELRDRELVALGSYHRAVAEVERLTGTPLPPGSPVPPPEKRK